VKQANLWFNAELRGVPLTELIVQMYILVTKL
jgi:hypothetical protein